MKVEMTLRLIIKDVDSVSQATKEMLNTLEWYKANSEVAFISAHEIVTFESVSVPADTVSVVS